MSSFMAPTLVWKTGHRVLDAEREGMGRLMQPMTPIQYAFEVAYDTALKVIDHSKVELLDVPGTRFFEQHMLPRLPEYLDASRLQEIDRAVTGR